MNKNKRNKKQFLKKLCSTKKSFENKQCLKICIKYVKYAKIKNKLKIK